MTSSNVGGKVVSERLNYRAALLKNNCWRRELWLFPESPSRGAAGMLHRAADLFVFAEPCGSDDDSMPSGRCSWRAMSLSLLRSTHPRSCAKCRSGWSRGWSNQISAR